MLYLPINHVVLRLCEDNWPNPGRIYLFNVNNRNTKSYQWRYQKGVIEIALVSSLLDLNCFKSFPSFPIVDFVQINICWGNYMTFYSFDISFNVSTGGRQDLTRSNARNSVIFLISHTEWGVTFTSLRLLK